MNSKGLAALFILLCFGALGFVFFLQGTDLSYVEGEYFFQDEDDEQDQNQAIGDDEREYVASGDYLIYSVTSIVDKGPEEWANDDVEEVVLYRYRLGDDAPVEFFRKQRDPAETPGGFTTGIYGEDVLAHRYAADLMAVISLSGDVETELDRWGTLRSENGVFQIDYDSIYDDEISPMLTLANRERGVSELIDLNKLDNEKIGQWTAPTHIDDTGSWIVLNSSLPMEGFVRDSGTFLYHLDSNNLIDLGEVEGLQKILALEDVQEGGDPSKEAYWQYDADLEKILLTIFTKHDQVESMMGWVPGAPTTVYEIDPFGKDPSKVLFEDDTFHLDNLRYSPDGEMMHYSIDGDGVWIAPVGVQRQNVHRVTSGYLEDWLEGGIVVSREQDDLVYIDLNSRDIMPLDRSVGARGDQDYQRVEYIGSITIE